MGYQYYFSGTQCALFINAVRVDELASIGINKTTVQVPRYHYTDENPRNIVNGRSLVQGEIVVNYVHPIYLNLYIINQTNMLPKLEKKAEKYRTMIGEVFGKEEPVIENRPMAIWTINQGDEKGSPGFSVADFSTTIPIDTGNTTSTQGLEVTEEDIENLESMFWDNVGNEPYVELSNSGIESLEPVDMIFYVGDSFESKHLLVGAKFSGPTLQTSNDGTPLFQIYKFLARDFK